jgi:hypothetical protein
VGTKNRRPTLHQGHKGTYVGAKDRSQVANNIPRTGGQKYGYSRPEANKIPKTGGQKYAFPRQEANNIPGTGRQKFGYQGPKRQAIYQRIRGQKFCYQGQEGKNVRTKNWRPTIYHGHVTKNITGKGGRNNVCN